MGEGEIVFEQCHPEILAQLRLLDKTIADCKRLQSATMDAYTAGRQWDFSKVSVDLSLDTGMFTITEKAPVPSEVPA